MNILVVDCRHQQNWRRASDMERALKNAGHNVWIAPHVADVESATTLETDWNGHATAVSSTAQDKDLIILHVGNEQWGAEKALTESYRDKAVLCFSGKCLPEWCLEDCRRNPKHCYFPQAVGSEIDPRDAEKICSYAAAVQRAIEAERRGNGGESAAILEQARNEILGFDPILESKLEVLCQLLVGESVENLKNTEDWKTLAGHERWGKVLGSLVEGSSNLEGSPNLKEWRDRLLPDEPEWAQESSRGN